MVKIKSLEELKRIKEQAQNSVSLRVKGDNIENMIQIRVAMATCGIASGAREVMNEFVEALREEKIENAVVTQTGCMGYCYAEPTVEVKKPGADPIVFGYVNQAKAVDLVDKYILNNELLEGIIPVNYEKIDK